MSLHLTEEQIRMGVAVAFSLLAFLYVLSRCFKG